MIITLLSETLYPDWSVGLDDLVKIGWLHYPDLFTLEYSLSLYNIP